MTYEVLVPYSIHQPNTPIPSDAKYKDRDEGWIGYIRIHRWIKHNVEIGE